MPGIYEEEVAAVVRRRANADAANTAPRSAGAHRRHARTRQTNAQRTPMNGLQRYPPALTASPSPHHDFLYRDRRVPGLTH